MLLKELKRWWEWLFKLCCCNTCFLVTQITFSMHNSVELNPKMLVFLRFWGFYLGKKKGPVTKHPSCGQMCDLEGIYLKWRPAGVHRVPSNLRPAGEQCSVNPRSRRKNSLNIFSSKWSWWALLRNNSHENALLN